jgi:phosphatidylinositol-bisphosphatase
MPVAGMLQAKVRMVVQEKRREVASEIHRLLDKVENDHKPRLQLQCPPPMAAVAGAGAATARPPNSLDFGLVRYAVAATQTLVVTNVSPVAAHFRFVPKLEEEAICKEWLQIRPRFGMLLPNEKAEIAFTVHVDLRTAQALNRGEALLDDILILRLENGQDFFLSIQGHYARSCFGMSLEELNNAHDPVRALPLPTKELWRLVDALYRTGLAEKDLFILPGVPEEVAAVREALDTGAELGPVSAHSLAEVLMAFLQALAAPVVPARLLPTMEVRCVGGYGWGLVDDG